MLIVGVFQTSTENEHWTQKVKEGRKTTADIIGTADIFELQIPICYRLKN